MSPRTPATVVSIVGKGRSGTTLLDLALGSLPGFLSLGEVWRWETFHRFDENRCGCGASLGACELWGPVLRAVTEAHPSGAGVWRQVEAWEREVARWRNVPRLLRHRAGALSSWKALGGLARHASLLYRTVADEAGSEVLVDSSNWPLNPASLGLVPDVHTVVVQLVRDPRGVAFSWQREKSLADGRGEMPRRGAAQSALSWMARNGAAEIARRRAGDRGVLARYEDFVRDPRTVVSSVVEATGSGGVDLSTIRGSSLHLPPNHTVAGNPGRFRSGEVELELDTEWARAQSAGDRLTVTALTLPLLVRYGYPLLTI